MTLFATVVLLRSGLPAPELSGPVETVAAAGFEVHFTREGSDAPPREDDDRNGLPDTIDAFVEGLVEGSAELEAEGWRPLAPDDGNGGSPARDVYVHEIGANGYAYRVPADDGSASCALALHPGLTTTASVARSVAVHELHHCYQYRYTTAVDNWLYESAATYEQYAHTPDALLDLSASVLYATRFNTPELPLGATDGIYEYSGFVWWKFWAELDGPDEHRLVEAWEALEAEPDWQETLHAEGARLFDRDLGDLFGEHATWNAFSCRNDDRAHYLPAPLPCLGDVGVPIQPWDGSEVTVVHEDGPFTAAYLELPGRMRAVHCTGSEGLQVGLVQVRGGARRATATTRQPELGVAVPRGDSTLVVLTSTVEPLEATCTAREPTEVAAGCATGPAYDRWWDLLSRRRR